MNRFSLAKLIFLITVAVSVVSCSNIPPSQQPNTVVKMYVLYCGEGHSMDQSRWSPGVNVGKPMTLTNSCYLIQHAKGWVLWETGFGEDLSKMMPKGLDAGPIVWQWNYPLTLTEQLAQIGVAPKDIKYIAFSHGHPDHIGNANLFPTANLLIQQSEYEYAVGPFAKKWPAPANYQNLVKNQVTKIVGDYDIFGDGSLILFSTPGHTQGHQSLLVEFRKRGAILIIGDAAHFKDNFINRRSPVQNFSKEQTIESMDKIANLMNKYHAELWINHDADQTATMPRFPQYIE
ncbi:N-acyl homoserine lactonase family protein [Polynucleobacter rarus]|jgi:glyoxylase-like metal-dependent hydrolase (beta-lactamase superfamily II)|uniref:N-acyl homoserine lactonase family protein n=1 Tax=Polynucleobacter rarus TaxID=556055 RepID=UPI000D3EE1D0|nr:N-acyl homoserine lactonase family protein [Polynucleobacter rarus]